MSKQDELRELVAPKVALPMREKLFWFMCAIQCEDLDLAGMALMCEPDWFTRRIMSVMMRNFQDFC